MKADYQRVLLLRVVLFGQVQPVRLVRVVHIRQEGEYLRPRYIYLRNRNHRDSAQDRPLKHVCTHSARLAASPGTTPEMRQSPGEALLHKPAHADPISSLGQ